MFQAAAADGEVFELIIPTPYLVYDIASVLLLSLTRFGFLEMGAPEVLNKLLSL